jgi:hypothetical protein
VNGPGPDLTRSADDLFDTGPERSLGDPAAQDELRHRLLGDAPPDHRPPGLPDVSDLRSELQL